MWFFTHVWIVPAMMALSFLLILFFGKKMPKKGAEIGIVFVGAAFVLSLITAGNWITWTNDNPEVHAEGAEGVALSNVDPTCSKVAEEAAHEGEEAEHAEGVDDQGADDQGTDDHGTEAPAADDEHGAAAPAAEGESAAGAAARPTTRAARSPPRSGTARAEPPSPCRRTAAGPG